MLLATISLEYPLFREVERAVCEQCMCVRTAFGSRLHGCDTYLRVRLHKVNRFSKYKISTYLIIIRYKYTYIPTYDSGSYFVKFSLGTYYLPTEVLPELILKFIN